MALVIVIPLAVAVLLAERHWHRVQADCLANAARWRIREEIEALAHQVQG